MSSFPSLSAVLGPHITRCGLRHFLFSRQAFGVLLALVSLAKASLPACAQSPLPPQPVAILPRADHLLMLDRRVIASLENARLVVGIPRKDANNPLLIPDQPWENATNNYYPNVAWDPVSRVWNLWYKDVLADPEAIAKMDVPSTVHGVGWYLLHATSRDGALWTRPELGLHAYDHNAKNNIVARDCPNAGVFLDEQETDSARRYKMMYDVGLGNPRVRFSPDGVHWGEAVEPKGFRAQQGDTHNNGFRDPWTGKFLWFTKLYLGERLVSRLESDDFLNWRSSGVVLRSGINEGKETQTYALTAFPYANGYLGYLMLYHVKAGRTVDCELAWSADSVHWERVAPGSPLLPNGPAGSYDSGCIYAQAGAPVSKDGRVQIYYGGSSTPHLGWKRSGSLCLATLPEDGFAGFSPVDPARKGTVLTVPLRPQGGAIEVRSEGAVEVKREELSEGLFQLRIVLGAGAKVYSIVGATLADASPRPPVEGAPARESVKREPIRVDFKAGTAGWKALDSFTHIPEQECVRVRRGKGLRPFAFGEPLPGNWPEQFGGAALQISVRLRTPEVGGVARVEIFAKDIAPWYFEWKETLSAEWQTFQTTIQYGWSDAQAKAAGWTRSEQGFSWRETLEHAGRVVVMPSGGSAETFDLGHVLFEPK